MTGSLLQYGQAELPTENSTHSYWHRDPSRKLLGHRTTSDLPPKADIVVIGSGITGTFAARELIAGGRGVVMLDAREACWGATGRNGGHCHPGVWNNTPEVARFELATFNLIRGLVAEHDIPCSWHVAGGVHPIFPPEVLAAARKRISSLQQHPDLRDKAVLIQDSDELAARRVAPGALAAVYQPNAARCWAYKLVTWLLERLLAEHDAVAFNLQTNTPVERIQRRGSSWILHTPRGSVCAGDVLLASNAYTSHLLPQMAGLILPVRGQVCALEPLPGAPHLPHNYVWIKSEERQYFTHQYLIQLGPQGEEDDGGEWSLSPAEDRPLVFGCDYTAPGRGEGISRDDEVDPILSRILHMGLSKAVKLLPGDQPEREELRVAYEWTGIMGYSLDGGPWVGRVPEALMHNLDVEGDVGGLWISAGYTGHGMPVAARCGVAVAEMMLGKEGGIQVPIQWIASEERAERARGLDIPRTIEEMGTMMVTE
ncbi:hypothetical protein DL770_003656 [Monosporascus sp. CRB-9-2]|nr:hypothetical protein DL770_003656 [Monosporascus sp. CRB-9-2]